MKHQTGNNAARRMPMAMCMPMGEGALLSGDLKN